MRGIDAWNLIAPILVEFMRKTDVKDYTQAYVMVYAALKRFDEVCDD